MLDFGERKKYDIWNLHNDIVITNRPTIFTIEDAKKYESIFCINTEKGIFYQKNNGSSFDIVFVNQTGSSIIMKNTFILASNLQFTCFIARNIISKKCFIMDTRGIFFELPELPNTNYYGPGQYSFSFDKKTGYYKIQDFCGTTLWMIKLLNDEETAAYQETIQPDLSLSINPKFQKFIKRRNLGKHRYLCFACDNSKQGQIIKWLMEHGLPYRIMPNIFIDDETVNIMIEVSLQNSKREDILYLLSKYNSSYSIFNISINQYLSAINSFRAREEFKINLPKLKEPQLKMCDTIINTMKLALNINSDDTLYEKIFRPILSLFYIKIDYNQNKGFNYAFIPLNGEEYDSVPNPFADKENLQKYESSILAQMEASGIKISKWKNEVEMFMVIYKKYPDAIYQYRSSWLKHQSLDVYIPSLNTGFEYQGIQHFEPIDFFGGKSAFTDTQRRDLQKKTLCQEQGIKLLYWRYDEPVNELILKKKLQE